MARRSADLPPKSPTLPADRDYSSGLRWSFFVHGAILLLILLKSMIFPGTTRMYIPSLRVDVVGLPDVLKKDKLNIPSQEIADALKKAEEAAKKIKPVIKRPEPKPIETAKPDEMVVKPKAVDTGKDRERRNRSALDRMKSLENIMDQPKVIVKGNKISKGTSLSGEARENAESGYYDSLKARLQQNWDLPVWIQRQNLSAQVQVYIGGRGQIVNFVFTKTSGNPQFDDDVKKALTQSQPLPIPPAGLSEMMLTHGISIGFPL
jgi:outer membrane biosynthesis protein TonB